MSCRGQSFVARRSVILHLGVAAALLVVLHAAVAGPVSGADEEDLYDVLGLGSQREDASEREVKSAWRKLSKKHHPDVAGESQREVYQRIQRAYEVLGDRRKRKVYDILGHDGIKKFEQPQSQQHSQMDSFFSFFGGGHQQQQGNRGKNEDFLLLVPLEDVYSGAAHTVKLERTKVCRACRGTGARRKEDFKQCSQCRGEGRVVRRLQLAPGFVQHVEQMCDHCSGSGRIVAVKCPVCQGRQTVRGSSSISIDIEQGIPDGHTITYELEADQQPNQVPGDVVFTVTTAPHASFNRSGDDLSVTVKLSLKDALLGFSKKLRHIDGHEVELNEPGITQHGERRKIVGEGMPKHHVPSEHGDLHVTYTVELPSVMTESQREMVRRVFG